MRGLYYRVVSSPREEVAITPPPAPSPPRLSTTGGGISFRVHPNDDNEQNI